MIDEIYEDTRAGMDKAVSNLKKELKQNSEEGEGDDEKTI